MEQSRLELGTPPPVIAVLYGGACWQKQPWDKVLKDYTLVHATKVSSRLINRRRLDFSDCDIFIVPWAPDQMLLRENAREIHEYVANGGILIALGEFDENWLPATYWRTGLSDHIRIEDSSSSVFSGLTSDQLSNWNDSSHGWFTAIPTRAHILARSEVRPSVWEPTMYIDRDSYSGTIFASTIDADFHTYNGSAYAEKLLSNICRWAINEYCEKDRIRGYRFRRRLVQRHRILEWTSASIVEIFLSLIVALLGYIFLHTR